MKDTKIYQWFDGFFESGTQYYHSAEDKQRVRQINLFNVITLLMLLPTLIIYNLVIKNYFELFIIIPLYPVFIGIFVLNRTGKMQLANFIAMISAMVAAYLVVFLSDERTELELVFLLIALGALQLIKHRMLKNIIIIVALSSYIISYYYSSKYFPFNEDVIFIISILLVFFYLALQNWDGQTRSYQKEIEEKNKLLELNNTTIKKQSKDLIYLQNTVHQSELTQKQKDMDTVLAGQAMQIKLKENMLEQLAVATKSNEPSKEIRSIMMDLKGQVEAQKKLNLFGDNMTEVNGVLFERLLAVHPNLTKSERELCAFLRLGLSNKEIASLKSSSDNSVHVLKSRLRAKLDLKSNHELIPYLLQF